MAGTIIFHVVLFLLLILVGFSTPPPPEIEEGIIVNFGMDETGMGVVEPSPAASQPESPPINDPAENVTEDEPLLTQDTEEAPEVKKVDPEAEKKRLEKIAADKIRKAELEAERIKKVQEEIERKRVIAEQQRQQDIINKTRDALANSKNAGTTSTSEGTAGGAGNQGSTTGSINSNVQGEGSGIGDKGISYDLGGRRHVTLTLPEYKYQEYGIVVVDIYVDKEGKVIRAVAGTKGSTILVEYLLNVARNAALQTRFEKSDQEVQRGTITYNFILK